MSFKKPSVAISVKELAEACGVTLKTISRYAECGMPMLARGRFDERECWQWCIARKESKVKEQLRMVGRREQEARLKRTQAEMAELDLAERNGKLIDPELIGAAMQSLVLQSRNHLEAIPCRLAPRLFGCKDAGEVNALLDKGIREAPVALGNAEVVPSAARGNSRRKKRFRRSSRQSMERPLAVSQEKDQPSHT